jgi:hypothetical protein
LGSNYPNNFNTNNNLSNLTNNYNNEKELIKRLNFEDSNSLNKTKENVNYGEIYDSLKKTNNYLYVFDLSRILFILILSLIIYFEFYLDEIFKESKERGIFITFLFSELSFTYICYKIKNKKKVKSYLISLG